MLSALLLGAAKKSESGLDSNLESIFKTSVRFLAIESSKNLIASLQAKAAPTPVTGDVVEAQSHDPLTKKRKRHDKDGVALSDTTERRAKKKSKQEQRAVDVSALPFAPETRRKKVQASSDPPLSHPTKNPPTLKTSPAGRLKGERINIEDKTTSPVYQDEQEEGWQEEGVNDDSDEHITGPPVHETIINSGMVPSVMKRRRSVYVPDGETKEMRDLRTVFIGNVPIEVAKSKVNYNICCTDLN
jgi:nucleolar protein 12